MTTLHGCGTARVDKPSRKGLVCVCSAARFIGQTETVAALSERRNKIISAVRNYSEARLHISTEGNEGSEDIGSNPFVSFVDFCETVRDVVQPFRAIIFDLDGVLADSEPWWNKIDAQLLREYGAKNYHGQYHENVLGVSYRLAVEFYKKAFGINAPTEDLMKRRGEIATEFFANRVGLFPNTKRVLEELREMKLRLAVATSSVSASARPFLDRHRIGKFFDVIITGDEIERGKPEPDIYLFAAENLKLRANECLVIEDSLSGIAAAKAAKMRVAAIPDRRFVDPREYEKEADYLLSDLSEIPPLVRSASVAA
jgi:HAD superfamily hydrolase (TIGR01509 family)